MKKLLQIIHWCWRCVKNRTFTFVKDEGKWEVYRCDECDIEYRAAVR